MRSEDLTVFIVDDDPGVRDSLALMLGLPAFARQYSLTPRHSLSAYQARVDWLRRR